MIRQELKDAGLKITNARSKILELFESSEQRHFSVDDIYRTLRDQGNDIALASIYRTLSQFESSGLLVRHRFDGDYAVYELVPDKHHDHLLCIKCGAIEEFVDPTIEERQQLIAQQRGFEITDHSLQIYGLCKACQKG